MFEKIADIIAKQLRADTEEITEDTNIMEDLGADSLDVFELLNQLEDEFGIVIPEEDMEGLVTVADVAAAIEKLV